MLLEQLFPLPPLQTHMEANSDHWNKIDINLKLTASLPNSSKKLYEEYNGYFQVSNT